MGTDLDDPNAVNSFLEVIGATLIGNTVQADTQSKVKADLSVVSLFPGSHTIDLIRLQ